MDALYWIEKLRLEQHPEGGYFKETYRSKDSIVHDALPSRFTGDRSVSTSIYFLLRSNDVSHFHRIKSDELWHYHQGGSLTVYVLMDGKLQTKSLGPNPENGQSLQIVVPANCWFGAVVDTGCEYVLSGCTVAPGFDFNDFELARRESLLLEYPQYGEIIQKLTK